MRIQKSPRSTKWKGLVGVSQETEKAASMRFHGMSCGSALLAGLVHRHLPRATPGPRWVEHSYQQLRAKG